MLNRRLLRIKVMQAIYAYTKLQAANYKISLNEIKDNFNDQIDITKYQYSDELKKKKKEEAINLFKKYYKNDAKIDSINEIEQIVDRVIKNYRTNVQKDLISISKQIAGTVENIYSRYIEILFLLVELVSFSQKVKSKSFNKDILNKLSGNAFIRLLSENILKKKKTYRWDNIRLNQWFGLFYKNEQLLILLDEADGSFEKDKNIIKHIVENIMLKDDQITSYFEEQDIYWIENQKILKNMIIKTIEETQAIQTNTLLLPFNYWDNYKVFLEMLFSYTIQFLSKYREIIAYQSKMWDFERIADIDKIILCMAICEMIHFDDIPIKVTINEYIEIAKCYSTPKSGSFVNGLMDIIFQKLKEDNQIKNDKEIT